jgi:protein ImuB
MSLAHRTPGRILVICCPDLLTGPAAPEAPPPVAGPAPAPEPRPATGELPVDPVFAQVVAAIEDFSPLVEVIVPGRCAISATAPARYFGGEQALLTRITSAISALGLTCQSGVADGLFAAQLAARAAAPGMSQPSPAGMIVPPGGTPAFLATYPVSVLEVPELSSLLPRLGIWTLGDFAQLPAAEAASRFGAAGAQAHRLARGLDPRPLIPRPPQADLSAGREFEPPAGLSEPVVFAAKALAEELHTGLAARGLACVRLRVEVAFADGRENIRLWRHEGLLSGLAVAERVRWQLDTWQTTPPAAPAAPPGLPDHSSHHGPAVGGIVRLRLVPDQLVRDTGRQLALWGETVISIRVARAAARVQAMLGSSAVTRPLLAGGRDPAEQVTLIPFGDAATPALPAGRPWPGHIPPPAPATVYDPPLPAQVTGEAAVPVEVTGRAAISAPPAWLSANGGPWLAVTAWAGPWPVTERWWAAIAARRRARFQLVTEDGTAWLAAVQGGQWTLEACYDLLPAGPGPGAVQQKTGQRGRQRGRWDGITRPYRGGNWNGGCPGASPATKGRRHRKDGRGSRTRTRNRRLRPPRGRPATTRKPAAPSGPSCTATRPTASLTVRPAPPTWSPRPPNAAWSPSPSPTTTACTACRSSPRPPAARRPQPAPGSALSSAPSSASACPAGRAAYPTRSAATFSY